MEGSRKLEHDLLWGPFMNQILVLGIFPCVCLIDFDTTTPVTQGGADDRPNTCSISLPWLTVLVKHNGLSHTSGLDAPWSLQSLAGL